MATKNVVIDWTLNLTREDGSDLPIEEIKGIELAISSNEGVDWAALPLFPATTLTTTIEDMDTGSHLVRGVVIDTLDQRSQPVTRPFEIGDPAAPSALGSLTVNIV